MTGLLISFWWKYWLYHFFFFTLERSDPCLLIYMLSTELPRVVLRLSKYTEGVGQKEGRA